MQLLRTHQNTSLSDDQTDPENPNRRDDQTDPENPNRRDDALESIL
jgi:hypothetical protein